MSHCNILLIEVPLDGESADCRKNLPALFPSLDDISEFSYVEWNADNDMSHSVVIDNEDAPSRPISRSLNSLHQPYDAERDVSLFVT